MSTAIVADSPTPDEPSRDIYFELKARGLKTRYIPIQRLSVKISNNEIQIETRRGPLDVRVVLIRGIGYVVDSNTFMRRVSVLKLLERGGVYTINPVEALLNCRNKLETMYYLSKAGVPIPLTVATEDLYYGYVTARQLGKVVLKPLQGSRGFGAMLFEDPEQAFQVMRSLLITKNPLYIQKYIEKPNRDIRIIVVDNQPIGCMYRISNTWKTNIAQGAVGVPCKLTPELEEIAIKATAALGLIYSGVDIGESREGYVVFEVNASPDWRGFKQATGINPAVYIANYVQYVLKR